VKLSANINTNVYFFFKNWDLFGFMKYENIFTEMIGVYFDREQAGK